MSIDFKDVMQNPSVTGQVFLMEQQSSRGGEKIVAIFGIIKVPDDVELNKQYDLFGEPKDGRIDLSIRNPHDWPERQAGKWLGMGITAMLTSPAWRV